MFTRTGRAPPRPAPPGGEGGAGGGSGGAPPPGQHWSIADRKLTSRLIVGTGGVRSLDVLGKVLAASGTELTTVAMRRLPAAGDGSLLGTIPHARVTMLPDTARCHTSPAAPQ